MAFLYKFNNGKVDGKDVIIAFSNTTLSRSNGINDTVSLPSSPYVGHMTELGSCVKRYRLIALLLKSKYIK